MTQSARALVVGPGEGPTVQGPAGGPLTFKVRGEQSGGALLVIENVIAPGDGPPKHTHAHNGEWWHVVAGDLWNISSTSSPRCPTGPIDRDAFARLGQAAGMNVVGPPLAVSHPL